jgi:hypothetical protein
VLPVGLERGGAPAQELRPRLGVLGDLVGPVVVELVVVPGDDPRVRGVGALQVRVRLVLRVAVAVVLERGDLPRRVRAGIAARGRVDVRRVLVDVVAEVQDDVQILLGQVVVGREVAVLVLRARDEREGHRVERGAGGRGRLRAADRAELPAARKRKKYSRPGSRPSSSTWTL